MRHDLAVLQPERAIAERFHFAGGVRNEQDGDSARAELVNFAQAALAEVDIAHGESFVHQKNFGIDVDRDREGQANHHAARIRLDRLVDEVADLSEFSDVREFAVHLLGGESKNRRVQIDVIAAREFGIEAGAEFEQRRDAAVNVHRAGGGLQNSRADLQQRALAAAILPDDAEGFAAVALRSVTSRSAQ